jgi:DNA-binding transcriptional LysR family regulator
VISRTIVDLEQSMVFPLFDPVGDRSIAMAGAQIFHRDVEESFEAFGFPRTRGDWSGDRGAGEIRVGTLSSLSTRAVPRAIVRFRTRHPRTGVTLRVPWSGDVRDCVA